VGGRILASLLAGWALIVPAFNDGSVIVSFFKTEERCEAYKQEQLRLMAGVVQKSIQDCAEDSTACDTDRRVSEGALGVIDAYQASVHGAQGLRAALLHPERIHWGEAPAMGGGACGLNRTADPRWD